MSRFGTGDRSSEPGMGVETINWLTWGLSIAAQPRPLAKKAALLR